MLNEKNVVICTSGKLMVEVLRGDDCTLACCGEPMKVLEEKTADAKTEKHVPVVEKIAGGFKVKVGSVPHPMEADHFIEWIEVSTADKVYKQFLKPGQPAEAVFMIDADAVVAREHCNKHGLWRG